MLKIFVFTLRQLPLNCKKQMKLEKFDQNRLHLFFFDVIGNFLISRYLIYEQIFTFPLCRLKWAIHKKLCFWCKFNKRATYRKCSSFRRLAIFPIWIDSKSIASLINFHWIRQRYNSLAATRFESENESGMAWASLFGSVVEWM